MRFEPGYLIGMILQSVPEPRKVADDVLSLGAPRAALWQAFVLFSVLRTGLAVAARMLFPVDPAQMGIFATPPLTLGAIETATMLFAVVAIFRIGRALGGQGSFDQALTTIVWLLFVFFILDLVVFALLLFAPALGLLLNLAGIVLGFWTLTHFIAHQHGFQSAGLVFAMIMITLIAALFILSLAMAILGLAPQLPEAA